MNIELSTEVFLQLSMIASTVKGREFSGYGFVETDNTVKDGPLFHVYDIVLLDVGTSGWTEFDSKAILEVLKRDDAKKMKLWFHRHPVGDGNPGPHNWSGTDKASCLNEPLGCPDPDMVKWALAIVLTPGGWVGRVDQFLKGKSKTTHLPVTIKMDWSNIDKAKAFLEQQIKGEQEVEYVVPYQGDLDGVDGSSMDWETAHADIDEAFRVLDTAEFQFVDGFQKEARESLIWAHDVALFYKGNPHVGKRAATLLRDVRQVRNLYRGIIKKKGRK